MLTLTRLAGETIVISTPSGDRITVRLIDIQSGRRARIGIDAPAACRIYRGEIQDNIDAADPSELIRKLPDRKAIRALRSKLPPFPSGVPKIGHRRGMSTAKIIEQLLAIWTTDPSHGVCLAGCHEYLDTLEARHAEEH